MKSLYRLQRRWTNKKTFKLQYSINGRRRKNILFKADRIHENLTDAAAEKIYEFSNFLFVLNVGFDNDDVLEITDMDFCSIINAINVHYAA